MTFYDNLKMICENKNIKPTPLIIECGGSKGMYTTWKNGAIPKADIVMALANRLGVSTDYLLFGKESALTPEEHQLISNFSALNSDNKIRALERIETLLESQTPNFHPKKTILIKHSSDKVSAGFGFNFEDYSQWDDIEVPLDEISRKADFCLTVEGDSMEPKFSDGDIVFVREQPVVDLGQIGIFSIDGKGYIKKFGGDRLISLNEDYDDILFADYDSDAIRCNGLVIG